MNNTRIKFYFIVKSCNRSLSAYGDDASDAIRLTAITYNAQAH